MESGDANQSLFNWKMLKESSVPKHPMENQFSNMSADLWKQKVTSLKQSWSQRVKLAHRIKESESSSLVYPTPSTTDGEGGSQMNQTEITSKGFKTIRKGTNIAYGSKLRDAVDKIESQKDGKKSWATPTARDFKDTPNDKSGMAMTLGRQVNGWQPSQAAQMKNKQNGKNQESWSTPQARDHQPSETKEKWEARAKEWKDKGINLHLPLNTQVQITQENWATPRAGAVDSTRPNGKGGIPLAQQVKERENWATPNTMDQMPPRSYEAAMKQATNQRKGRSSPSNLREQVDPTCVQAYKDAKNWPTPQVGGQDERADTRIARGRDLNLPAKATLDQPKGYLNPSWVEQLMGLPKGWTQLSSAEAESDNRVPRLKLLGNGVVPQCASKAFAILFNQIMNV